jgi:hypothetical protein
LRSHPSRLLTVKQMGSYSYQLTWPRLVYHPGDPIHLLTSMWNIWESTLGNLAWKHPPKTIVPCPPLPYLGSSQTALLL